MCARVTSAKCLIIHRCKIKKVSVLDVLLLFYVKFIRILKNHSRLITIFPLCFIHFWIYIYRHVDTVSGILKKYTVFVICLCLHLLYTAFVLGDNIWSNSAVVLHSSSLCFSAQSSSLFLMD